MSYGQALLFLGGVANLPTVWSNCLAGWSLGGGGDLRALLLVSLGASCLYLGGMFLNDAFDVDYDRQYRRDRPIPAGVITLDAVWRWGFAWLGLGIVLLVPLGPGAASVGMLLVACRIVYDAVHKDFLYAPLLLGAWRCGLYLMSAAVAREGITGLAIWCGLGLGVYVVGVGYLARHEADQPPTERWPIYLLAAPMLQGLILNGGDYFRRAVVLSAVLALWAFRSLQTSYGSGLPDLGRPVAGLWAGVVLVDLLAVAGGESWSSYLAFLGLFVATLLLQRFIPANSP